MPPTFPHRHHALPQISKRESPISPSSFGQNRTKHPMPFFKSLFIIIIWIGIFPLASSAPLTSTDRPGSTHRSGTNYIKYREWVRARGLPQIAPLPWPTELFHFPLALDAQRVVRVHDCKLGFRWFQAGRWSRARGWISGGVRVWKRLFSRRCETILGK